MSRLKKNFLRKKTEETRKLYVKQRNKCVSLLKKAKKEYYQNLDEKNVIDNKKFWKTVKPLLSDKSVSREKINLTENEKMLTSESETAETLNNFFSNIVKKLNIPKFNSNNSVTENIKDPVFKAILKYKNHPSILAIQKYSKNKTFHFEEVNSSEVEKKILQLDKTKASQKTHIPTRIVKENIDIFANFLCTGINSAIMSFSLPSYLKLADVTPVHKKGRKDMKENFRPVSILPTLSKIFEKCLFAKCLLYSTQHCLLVMLETWKRSVDKGKVFDALLTDLSKAFDCLDHELLTAKLNAYGFTLSALRLINDYLSNRKQRTKIENTYSTWLDIIFGVPQGSILGPLLFNVFLADLFFTVNGIDIASYADYNTPYMIANNVDDLIASLEHASSRLFKWLKSNLFKRNADKCHLLVSTNDRVSMNIDGFTMDKNDTGKLLGVTFDKKIDF